MRSRLRIIENQSAILVTFKASISNGQKDWRQTTRAMGQEKKRCKIESKGKEHREHEVSIGGEDKVCEILVFVWIIFQTIFHKKSFKRWLRLSFHRDFQLDLERGEEGIGGWEEVRRWWADFVEKKPLWWMEFIAVNLYHFW